MYFLELTNIRKEFATSVAVENFNLQAQRGEFISFLGPSGCGKTTVLRMVAGFEMPTSGTLQVNGRDITRMPPNQRKIGMVFQSYALFPNMTVADNVGFGLRVAGQPKEEIAARVKEMLHLIQMPEFSGRYPYQLSGGQQQRVALARALAIKPELLLLDEPLSALDAKVRGELRGEIRRIQQQLGITTIFVTHDQEEAMSISDRVVVMSKGHMEQVGTPFEIYNYPRTPFVASFVGTLNQLACRVENPATGTLNYHGQTFTTGTAISQPKDALVSLMLRPEELRIGIEGGVNRLVGTVQDVAFLGSIVRVKVALGNEGATLTADIFNERKLELPQVGKDYTLSFPPHACWVMEQGA
ncbi:MAG: ABC transporter ATP-binding protein [Anaerolineales bacterium]|nr:ABC transporter ATP-binding protein [Anaerolineales bacterium]